MLCVFCYLTGISEAQFCAKGEYSDGGGGCHSCPKGTFMDESDHGNIECSQCDSGTYAHEEGMVECAPCNAGYHALDVGQSECEACIPGTFSLSGAESCDSCPPGRVAESTGMDSCNDCPPGTYSGLGATVCLDCESDYHCPGDSNHIPCPSGTHSTTRATVCTGPLPCPTHWRKQKFHGYEDCLKHGKFG